MSRAKSKQPVNYKLPKQDERESAVAVRSVIYNGVPLAHCPIRGWFVAAEDFPSSLDGHFSTLTLAKEAVDNALHNLDSTEGE